MIADRKPKPSATWGDIAENWNTTNFFHAGSLQAIQVFLLTAEHSGSNSEDQIQKSSAKWPLKVLKSNCPLLKFQEFWKSTSFLWTPEFCWSSFSFEHWVLAKLSDFTPCCWKTLSRCYCKLQIVIIMALRRPQTRLELKTDDIDEYNKVRDEW